MSKLSIERAIEALYTVRAYYASLTAGYPKGKDCKGIGDVMCSEIANSCLMAIKALEQQPCEDCISREQAIRATYGFERYTGIDETPYEYVESILRDLPSVTPKGVTITDFADRCRECGKIKRCADCYYNDGEVHAECVICDKAESEDIE